MIVDRLFYRELFIYRSLYIISVDVTYEGIMRVNIEERDINNLGV